MGEVSNEKKKELFTLLLKTRRLEEKLIELMTTGEVAGWFHSNLGQEAVGVGVTAYLEPEDYINNTHRGRAIIIGKRVPLKRFMAEALGRKNGPCEGISGEMHYFDLKYGILGQSGTLGGQIPVAVGVALACQYRKSDQVVICIFGDGTVDEGNFHESLNIASLWKLPIVFVVENNGWAQFTPQKATASQVDIWRKAEGYNMLGKVVDGTDILEVYEVAREAIARARKGDGPTLIECKVRRWEGHYIGDPQKYRDPKDIEEARRVDPLSKFQKRLMDEKILTLESMNELDESVKREIEEAIQFAKSSPVASREQAFQNVYV